MMGCNNGCGCCGGGGGFNGIGLYREQRNIGLHPKLEQIKATGCNQVVAPCHNCWDAIRDMKEVYPEEAKDLEWFFLKPLLLKMVIVPENLKPKAELKTWCQNLTEQYQSLWRRL